VTVKGVRLFCERSSGSLVILDFGTWRYWGAISTSPVLQQRCLWLSRLVEMEHTYTLQLAGGRDDAALIEARRQRDKDCLDHGVTELESDTFTRVTIYIDESV
jgi:hypothetical protein